MGDTGEQGHLRERLTDALEAKIGAAFGGATGHMVAKELADAAMKALAIHDDLSELGMRDAIRNEMLSLAMAENDRLREALRLICTEGLTVERCFALASTALLEADQSGSNKQDYDG